MRRTQVQIVASQEDLHHSVRIGVHGRADGADLLREANIERMEAIVDVFLHLGDPDKDGLPTTHNTLIQLHHRRRIPGVS